MNEFVIVSDNRKQRMALSETVQKLGFRLVACLDSEQLKTDKVISHAVWLVDVDNLGQIESYIGACQPKLVLVGFDTAPDYTSGTLYDKWQRRLARKLSDAFSPKFASDKKAPMSKKPWRYVLFLGASMGGPHAIKAFLDGLSPKLPIAILVAHHFDDKLIYTLPKVLTRQNDWRCQVISTTQSLQAGLCLIVPTDRQVVCDSTGRVILTKQAWAGEYKPNIGAILKNVSEVYGSQLISIIFSGMGNDGSQFAKDIVKNQSQFWAQDPTSADSPSQPQAFIDTGVCQFIGTPKMMSDKLNQLMASHLMRCHDFNS